jgi:hypothetical protein
MSIDKRDPRTDLDSYSFPRVELLFSWTCEIAQDIFVYEHSSPDAVHLLKYKRGPAYEDFPYQEYPIAFPARRFLLRPLSDEEQSIVLARNRGALETSDPRNDRVDLTRPQHQIGGVPQLSQQLRDLVCPKCSSPMPFFASVCDETMTERPFVETEFVQLIYHLCRGCRVVSVYVDSD